MRVVNPVLVKPSDYNSSGFVDDQPLWGSWSSSLSYVLNNEVKYEGFVYRALASIAPGGLSPDLDPVRWERVKALSVHAAFDNQSSTTSKSQGSNYCFYLIGFALSEVKKIDTFAIFNVYGFTRVKLTVTQGFNTVLYEKEVNLSVLNLINWYDYFFTDSESINEVVFDNIPPPISQNFTYFIEFFDDEVAPDPSKERGVGTIVLGKSVTIGQTQMGANAGIIDYSRKETDQFGTTTFVKRAFSKRVSSSVIVENGSLNSIFTLLSSLRATPCLWLGTGFEQYGPLNVFGYYKDFSIDIAYPTQSLVSIDIEGLA